MEVFTIGHSNHSMEAFVELLRRHNVDVVTDVRSQPYSRYNRHFSKEPFSSALVEFGFQYVYLGDGLGGRPAEPSLLDPDGAVDYARVRQTPEFLGALNRLLKGLQTYRVALVCAEENPEHCHRRLLISPALRASGVSVLHIRKDGTASSDEMYDDPQGTLL